MSGGIGEIGQEPRTNGAQAVLAEAGTKEKNGRWRAGVKLPVVEPWPDAGIQAEHQQSVDFIVFKGFATFELSVNPDRRPAQLRRVHPFAGITKGVVADLAFVAHPPLPLGQFSFGL